LKKNNLYYIIAGESSGDLHGSKIIESMQNINSNLHFRGLGGPLMSESGLKSLEDFNKLAVMGFLEVLKDLPFFLNLKKKIISDICNKNPEKIILIDYPGFNLSLAKTLKKHTDIPILYYISPQVWAWKEKRVSIIQKYIDKLIVIFPFEKTWFKQKNIEVEYFGHPLIDIYKNPLNYKNQSEKSISFFPGSRLQEIRRHVPIIKKIIEKLLIENTDLTFIVSLTKGIDKKELDILSTINSVLIDTSESINTFNNSSVSIIASGTATLECALSNTPLIVIYKTSFISWFIAKMFLKTPFISIVNILAQKKIVSEYIQYDINIKTICSEIIDLLNNSTSIKKELKKMTKTLGMGNAYNNSAKYIIDFKR
jgi:lipid-A-disaccharide synthase